MLRKKLLSINTAFNLSFMMQLILVGIGCFVIYTTSTDDKSEEIEKEEVSTFTITSIVNENKTDTVNTIDIVNNVNSYISNISSEIIIPVSEKCLCNEDITSATTIETTEEIKYYDTYSSITDKDVCIYSLSLPKHNTDFKAFMDYRYITDTTSDQWELSQIAYTDEYGLRKVDDYYCVAMGSYYSENVGDKFEITLENGNKFNVIIGDLKQDCHTDATNQYTPVYDNNGNFYGANVIEFIVDDNVIDEMVLTLGTISYYEQFEGNITNIKKIEERVETDE